MAQGHMTPAHLLQLEHLPVKAVGPAVQLLGPLVGNQGQLLAVQTASGPGDPVAVPSDDGSQVAAVLLISGDTAVSQHHVQRFPVRARDPQSAQGRAVGDDLRCQGSLAQGIFLYRSAVCGRAEGRSFYCHGISSFFPMQDRSCYSLA